MCVCVCVCVCVCHRECGSMWLHVFVWYNIRKESRHGCIIFVIEITGDIKCFCDFSV